MSFQLTEEQKMVRLMARDFAKKELEPFAAQRDREEIFPMDVVKKMGELGLLGMMVPFEYGGAGAGAVSALVIGVMAFVLIRAHTGALLKERTRSASQLSETIRQSTYHDMLENRRDNLHRQISEIGQRIISWILSFVQG